PARLQFRPLDPHSVAAQLGRPWLGLRRGVALGNALSSLNLLLANMDSISWILNEQRRSLPAAVISTYNRFRPGCDYRAAAGKTDRDNLPLAATDCKHDGGAGHSFVVS